MLPRPETRRWSKILRGPKVLAYPKVLMYPKVLFSPTTPRSPESRPGHPCRGKSARPEWRW